MKQVTGIPVPLLYPSTGRTLYLVPSSSAPDTGKTRFLSYEKMKVNTGISITGPSSEEKENVRAKQIKKLKENDMGTEHQIDGAMQRKET